MIKIYYFEPEKRLIGLIHEIFYLSFVNKLNTLRLYDDYMA